MVQRSVRAGGMTDGLDFFLSSFEGLIVHKKVSEIGRNGLNLFLNAYISDVVVGTMDEVKNVLLYSDIYHHLAPRIVGHQCPWVYQGHRVAAHPVSRLIDWSQRAVHHVPGCEKDIFGRHLIVISSTTVLLTFNTARLNLRTFS